MSDASPNKVRNYIRRLSVLLWWHMPLNRQIKEKLKSITFSTLPFLFRNSRPYQNWLYIKKTGSAKDDFDVNAIPDHWPKDKNHPQLLHHQYKNKALPAETDDSLAVIIHVFYRDIFDEMLDYLHPLKERKCKLFIGTTRENQNAVAERMQNSVFAYQIDVFENRGRDILPFLSIAEEAIREGYKIILKLHTKKSDHRLTGELWRKDIYKKLLDPKAVERIMEVLKQHSHHGLIGPAGHIIPINLYYGKNARAIGYLSYRLRLPPQKLKELAFVAGSMFYIRSEALLPLLALKLKPEMFEDEAGQVDGTMAHAVERIFAVSTSMAGYTVADSSVSSKDMEAHITKEHPFTW